MAVQQAKTPGNVHCEIPICTGLQLGHELGEQQDVCMLVCVHLNFKTFTSARIFCSQKSTGHGHINIFSSFDLFWLFPKWFPICSVWLFLRTWCHFSSVCIQQCAFLSHFVSPKKHTTLQGASTNIIQSHHTRIQGQDVQTLAARFGTLGQVYIDLGTSALCL